MPETPISTYRFSWYCRYFLKLGAIGFGGPLAILSYVQKDLVENSDAVSREEFLEGVALSQLAPGSIALQIAMYIGWLRRGAFGAAVLGALFILPSLIMVLALAAVYVRLGSMPTEQKIFDGIFYGVGAGVIAIIAVGAARMSRLVLKREPLLWGVFAVSLVLSLAVNIQPFWLFVVSGLAVLVIRREVMPRLFSIAFFPALQFAAAAASGSLLLHLFIYFFCAGAVIVGGGLVIVPYLHQGVVEQYHWITERQFLDAVAVSMITPGPAVIAVAFIGFLVAGFTGASVSTLGIFLPALIIIVVAASYYRRAQNNPALKAFVEGVTSAAIGAMAATVWTLSLHGIVDWLTALIAVSTLALLLVFDNLPEPLLLFAAAILGVAWKYLAV